MTVANRVTLHQTYEFIVMKLINENKLTQEEAENILLDLEDMEDDEEEI